jgi:hypothetical protein
MGVALMSIAIEQLLLGAIATASGVAALFFLRFWKVTRDRLFLFFALAFFMLGVTWTATGVARPAAETKHYFYVPRLIAFALIIAGVADKNRRR